MNKLIVIIFMYSVICTQEVLDTKETPTSKEPPRATLIQDKGWDSELKFLFDVGSTK